MSPARARTYLFSMACRYEIVIQRSLVVYHGIPHLTCQLHFLGTHMSLLASVCIDKIQITKVNMLFAAYVHRDMYNCYDYVK